MGPTSRRIRKQVFCQFGSLAPLTRLVTPEEDAPEGGNVGTNFVEEMRHIGLRQFFELAWPIVNPGREFVPGWHVDAIAEHIEAWSKRDIQNLIINMPPGFGKSIYLVMYFAWRWIRRPSYQAIFASHTQNLAERDSIRTRDLIESDWYRASFLPPWGPQSGMWQVRQFANTAGGKRQCLSVGGAVTGYRGDDIIVDDPLNAEQEYTQKQIEDVLTWFGVKMNSRLNDQNRGGKLVVQQRLHERDLSGVLIEQSQEFGAKWDVLTISQEFDPASRCVTSIGWEDPRSTEGELLCPALFDEQAVEAAKLPPPTGMGVQAFEAQHNQRPRPLRGDVFNDEQFRRFSAFPDRIDCIYQSWDCSFKNSATSDYVAGQVWAVVGPYRYLLDRLCARLSFTETIEAIRAMKAKWPGTSIIVIEDKANGPAIIDSLQRQGLGIVPYNPDVSKIARARAVTAETEAGLVYIPNEELCPWVKNWLAQVIPFPRVAHDDEVDAFTMAILFGRHLGDSLSQPPPLTSNSRGAINLA